MSSQPRNPYQPPFDLNQPDGWWTKFRGFFRKVTLAGQADFRGGEAIICDGIAFFIDPGNPTELYAASPSTDASQRRMELIAEEAVRVLPLLLADHPRLQKQISERKIVVRMISQYTDSQAEYHRQAITDLRVADIIAVADAVLESSDESSLADGR